ncbi:sugar phosphate isomerase/epimerase family protein [Lysinibacillus halotolerans]|uniref:Sugar phosphate isomerase/epimerase n=1 Tax=Lysinibacillus halotolerans TaxID=1368476 RepID=A0A3M8H4A2_9BACI|nr:sugar phosphate isomerase/epimerase [Lysinibacillus halotolerans]RNC97252.1 sugar phosphate isomerase/epimerase [Lysinibacillus halotolerans]
MELGIFTRVFQEKNLEETFELITQKYSIRNVELTANKGSRHINLSDPDIDYLVKMVDKYNVKITALSMHRDTQLIMGPHGKATKHFFDGSMDEQIEYGIKITKKAAEIAKELNIPMVIGNLGAINFSELFEWPNKNGWKEQQEIAKERWYPILEYYEKKGIKFAHELGPQQIAYNLETAEEILEKLDFIDSLGFCIDPSQLLYTGVDTSVCIERLNKRVFNFHAKDGEFTQHLKTSGWLPHGDINRLNRGYRNRIPGWGSSDWRKIMTSLKIIKYSGPISIEIEDPFVDADEALNKTIEYLRPLLFKGDIR